ncbi:hypothetical protein [Cupriavidus necator]
MSISSARQELLLRGQTAIARKVFELVPIQDAWESKQIHVALQRTTRCSMDYRVLQGCLRALRESGLVFEPKNGLYQRTTLRKAMPTTHMNGTEPTRQPPTSAIELLTELSERARQLAQDIDAAAAVIAEEAAQKEESLRKLVQLQSILKSLA